MRRPLILAALALAVLPATAHAATTAAFTTKSDWGEGFTGQYVLTNTGSAPITQWRLEFDLAPGQRLSSAWGALINRSDQHYVLTPIAYTKTIRPGASVTLGFEGTEERGPFVPPLNCLLDGLPCDGGSASAAPATPPATPANLAARERTPASVTLTWTASAGATSYDVLRDGTKIATATSASAQVGGLSGGSTYTFAVRAVDAAGQRSASSAPLRVTTPTAEPTLNGALSADFATVNDWGTGYVASIVIRNHVQRPVHDWRLTLDLPAGSTLDSAWNAKLASTGTRATLTPAFWTDEIPAGGSIYVGFQGTTIGPFFPGPAQCLINGASCTTSPNVPISSAPATTSAPSASPIRGRRSGATPPSFAPYVDLTLLPAFPMADAVAAKALRDATLAFVVSAGACQAAWGGVTRLDDPAVTGPLNALRAGGGSAIVSFGGRSGRELATTCPDAGALAAQYQSVIDLYGVRDLDFALSGDEPVATLTRRAQALAQLQATGRAAGRPVHVSFTLPATPRGLTAGGRRALRVAIAHGVDVGTVNLLAIDVPGSGGAIAAARAAHEQLAAIYRHRDAAARWRMLGLTTMLGANDAPGHTFTLGDATRVATFARTQHLGRLSLWSANRDAPCPAPTMAADDRCSGVDAPSWAFSRAYVSFR